MSHNLFFVFNLSKCLFLCLAEQKVWTVVLHNTTNAVKVQGSTPERPHVMQINYSASPDQLHALVASSDQCQQEVVYQCRKSRLFNTWGRTHNSFQVSHGRNVVISPLVGLIGYQWDFEQTHPLCGLGVLLVLQNKVCVPSPRELRKSHQSLDFLYCLSSCSAVGWSCKGS